ncbi:hypothetical protein CXG81DRAFT_12572 [Caulochytrium protostelioides]|uniref:t-SNARE affecting a late Golgi compartment protein 1 n=1 Tax=Caulochytrium protostelioides TaxID=1555241 RepID=A0A4P9WV44_9FUNG|nr:hypothetical protein CAUPRSCDRAFT_8097 [Caulochytrium protostelioides]RKP00985.1 hypothetical protein CXG81DRAFT_12572 [Caulochytrium protostelioides]|eukprot:RKP00985.1 hypothetical protein CXG81DRAFT_12572 [Caulochytrium protostelioides]
MEDPYYGVKDDIEAGLQTLNRQVAQWQRLTATPASPPQITASADEIRNTLGTIEMDLNDLEDTVRIVEANPTRFHLTTAETNAAFMDREQQQQQQLMRRQDDQLDQVMHTVGNMKEVAYVIGRELEDQAVLLDDLEVKVDSASGKLQLGMNRMRDFIKSNSDTKQQWTIICLIIVLIILIILVIYI